MGLAQVGVTLGWGKPGKNRKQCPFGVGSSNVFVENIRQEPTTAYSVDGTTLTFTAAPVTGTNNIYVVNRGPIQLSASHPAAQSLSAFSATITNDLTVDTDTLFVDSTNNRVGVGTASPAHLIDCRTTGETEQVVANFSSTGDGSDRQRLEIYVDPSTQTTELYGGAGGGSENNTNLAFSTRQGGSGRVEAMRIDSSGNLLVGTTDTTPYNNSAGTDADNGVVISEGRVWAARNGGSPIDLNRTNDDGDIAVFRKDGSSVGSIGTASGYPYVAAPSNFSLMLVTNDLRPRTNTGASNNDNTVSLGVSSSRFKDLYLGGGAYIGGTGSANYLDDYEEGTFTPTYLGSTTNPTVTYDSQTSGSYVKIGRQVIAKIVLRTDSVSGGSGNLYIGGLPFLASTVSGNRAGTLNVGYTSNFVTESPQSGYINDGNTYAILVTNQSSDARSDSNNAVGVSNMQTGTNDNFIMSTLIYET